jgi:hypothetical protein
MTAPVGTIYYTLDGSDPRQAVTGTAVGTVYSTSAVLTESVVVKARALDNGEWSALSEAQYLVGTPAAAGDLVVSELMYRPAGDGLAEFIELLNISPGTVDLTDVRFDAGVSFAFPINTTLAAGERLLIGRDQTAFELANGAGLPVVGAFADDTVLSDAGETITLLDYNGAPIIDFEYNDAGAWPRGADGLGYSLVLINPDTNPNHGDPTSWRSSTSAGGNPNSFDNSTYAAWVVTNAIADPQSDDDRDGLAALIEYLVGSDPAAFSSNPIVLPVFTPGDLVTVQVHRAVGADDVDVIIEYSTDLSNWSPFPGGIELIRNDRLAPGGEILTFRSFDPVPAGDQQFIRVGVSLP